MIRTIGEISTLSNRKVVATLEKDEGDVFVVLKAHTKTHGKWIPEKTTAFLFNPEAWAEFKELVKKIDQTMMRTEPRKVRFGVIAVKKGYVTLKQVIDALGIQAKQNLSGGKHKHIGQILLEQGHISRAQLDDILQTLKQTKEPRS